MAHDDLPNEPVERPARAEQLPLLEIARPQWQLDDHTREVGRRGVQRAREALAAARHAA